MIRSIRQTLGYRIHATDGELGRTSDYYFGDDTWRIRYLVVRAGSWLSGRQVLISPQCVGEPDWHSGALPVALTMKQVQDSPSIETDLPVSRQQEARLARYYNWVPYWELPGIMVPVPAEPAPAQASESPPAAEGHLRGVREVTGYHISASDGEVGHLADFLAQTSIWAIRYLVVDLSRWLPNRKVLISPAWVTSIDWSDKRVHVDLSTQQVRGSLPFDPAAAVNREFEVRLYDYYGRPKYWESEPQDAPPSPRMPGAGKGK
jgi:hypothetical protein